MVTTWIAHGYSNTTPRWCLPCPGRPGLDAPSGYRPSAVERPSSALRELSSQGLRSEFQSRPQRRSSRSPPDGGELSIELVGSRTSAPSVAKPLAVGHGVVPAHTSTGRLRGNLVPSAAPRPGLLPRLISVQSPSPVPVLARPCWTEGDRIARHRERLHSAGERLLLDLNGYLGALDPVPLDVGQTILPQSYPGPPVAEQG